MWQVVGVMDSLDRRPAEKSSVAKPNGGSCGARADQPRPAADSKGGTTTTRQKQPALQKLFEADAGTRTGDPFITSEVGRFLLVVSSRQIAWKSARRDRVEDCPRSLWSASWCTRCVPGPDLGRRTEPLFGPRSGSEWLSEPAHLTPRRRRRPCRCHPCSLCALTSRQRGPCVLRQSSEPGRAGQEAGHLW